jgi:hypothetical protein
MSVVVKHITDPVPHILDVKPDLPPAIESVIEKAMAKDRDQRFPTVKSLADALSAVAHGETPVLDISDRTLVTSAKTVIAPKPTPPSGTVPAKQASASAPVPPAPRKKTGLWIGLGGAVLLVCVVGVGGIFMLRNKIPFLAASTSTFSQTTSQPAKTDVHQPTNTDIPVVLNPTGNADTPTPSIAASPSPTSTLAGPVKIGGADMIAFLNNNDIWVMGVDGSNLTQVTKGGGTKTDLQWSPDGQTLFYISGLCIQSVALSDGIVTEVTCFPAATYLEAFEISPDGKQVALNLNRVLYVVPFDVTAISQAHTWMQLRDMKGCYTYNAAQNQAAPKSVRWSNDGKYLAINTNSVDSGKKVDLIDIFDVSTCNSTNPIPLDCFPATRFTMTGYGTNGTIPSFDSDGSTLYVLNSKIRYELGYLYSYNTETKHNENLDPLQATCCYTAARFSPDGTYLLFFYQNVNNAITQVYYISYGSIGTGVTYAPLKLPAGFFSNLADHLDATIRPAIP